MAQITESEITCPHLKSAYEAALSHAYMRSRPIDGNISYNSDYGNQVTASEGVKSYANCTACSKLIAIVLHFQRISATDTDTGKPAKIYTTLDPNTSISVSGHKCITEHN